MTTTQSAIEVRSIDYVPLNMYGGSLTLIGAVDPVAHAEPARSPWASPRRSP